MRLLAPREVRADETELLKQVKGGPIPAHVAIIMDGNGRWASRRGLPRAVGHRAGLEALRRVVRASSRLGIRYLTLFAFSTENWKRPRDEVDALMGLLVEYLRREIDELHRNGVVITTIGHLEELPEAARREVQAAVEKTRGNASLRVVLALNYGSRREIADAARALARGCVEDGADWRGIDEDALGGMLSTAGIPDPDLIIRPSGEMRISNFLLWQAAYAELWTTPVLWPDFRPVHLYSAVRDFQARDRRFGGLKRC